MCVLLGSYRMRRNRQTIPSRRLKPYELRQNHQLVNTTRKAAAKKENKCSCPTPNNPLRVCNFIRTNRDTWWRSKQERREGGAREKNVLLLQKDCHHIEDHHKEPTRSYWCMRYSTRSQIRSLCRNTPVYFWRCEHRRSRDTSTSSFIDDISEAWGVTMQQGDWSTSTQIQ